MNTFFLLLPCHTLLLGLHDLPVLQLFPPEESCTSEKIGPHFVKILKQSIKCDPTGTGLPPLVFFLQPSQQRGVWFEAKRCVPIWGGRRAPQLYSKEGTGRRVPSKSILQNCWSLSLCWPYRWTSPKYALCVCVCVCVFVCVCVCECVVCTFGVEKIIC